MHFMPTFHDNQWLTKNIFINIKEYTEGWVNMPRATGDKQETQTFYRGYWDWAADFAFSFLFRACGEMFCLWWKVCLSPSSNIYLAQLLSRFWYRQYWEREEWSTSGLNTGISLWIQFVSLCTGSIVRVICHLDRRHIGVLWQGTWHGSCDMTWYDIVTTPVGGHQPANTDIDVVRSDLRGQYWHYCSSRGYWHYWGGGCCCGETEGGYQCLPGHTGHTLHSLSDLSHPTWTGPNVGLLSAIIMDPT